MSDELLYPTAEDVLAIHEDVVASDPGIEPSVRTPGAVSSALAYVSEGYFGQVPETTHEKAAHLIRLLAADRPFVDGNKRTALASVATLYAMNGYSFEYDDDIRTILKRLGTDESAVDVEAIAEYYRENGIDMTAQRSETDQEYARERARLRERIRTTDSDTERREAVRRLAEIDREVHADIYEKLTRE